MRAVAIIPLCVCLLSSAFAKPPVLLNYQDGDGQYNFGYSDPLSMRTESRTLDGVTRGTYSYYDDKGVIQTTEYEAGKDIGFRVKATNLPQAPLPVLETPEVKNAREKHLLLLEEVQRREEEEKKSLSQVDEAKPASESIETAIPEATTAPIPQAKETLSTENLPKTDARSQPHLEAINPALPLQQQQQQQVANLRSPSVLPEPIAPIPQAVQAGEQKQQEISSKNNQNQGPPLEPSILPANRAFAAQNPFLIPFLGQGFSFESALPQQRGISVQQNQEKTTAENINSQLPTESIQGRISEQSAIPKQSTLPDQRPFPVPGIQGQPESQIQNTFSERAFSNQNKSPSEISTGQFAFEFHGLNQPTVPKQTTLIDQRAFPQNEVPGQQRLSIQSALPQPQLEFRTPNGFSGQQGFPTQDAMQQQRTVPAQTVLPRQQGLTALNTRLSQSEFLRQPGFPEQRTVLAQGGLSTSQVFPSANAFFGQGLFDPLLRQQGLLAQHHFSEQQTIPRQNVISEQQHGIQRQSVNAEQQTIPRQNIISEEQVKKSAVLQPQVTSQQIIPRQNIASERQMISQSNVIPSQQFMVQQGSTLQQEAIPRQNVAPEQQLILQPSAISGQQQFIQQQSSIPEQKAIPRQNIALEQQLALQPSAISGQQQFLQPQGSILEQQVIPRQNIALEQQLALQPSAISGQHESFIQRQNSIFEHQSIPRYNSVIEQQAVPQQNAVNNQQLIPQQGSTSEQQIISRHKDISEHKEITQKNVVPEQQTVPQQSAIPDQQAIARQIGFPVHQLLLGQQSTISEQQRIAQAGSIFDQQTNLRFNPIFVQQGEIHNQAGVLRQSITEQQTIPAQAAGPEQRAAIAQNLTPSQESDPKGFLIPDQTNLHTASSNLAAVKVPEPVKLPSIAVPEPVKYTPEVMAARAAHFRAYTIAARLAEESDRNPQILIQLLEDPAANIAQVVQRENQPDNRVASKSAVSPTAAPVIKNLQTKSADKTQGILPKDAKAPEQRIESSAQSVEAKKIDNAEKVQPYNVPSIIEQPKARTGLTPASTSLRIMDTRLPSLNEFQQSKLKEALALTCDTSLKVTEDKETTTKSDQHLSIIKPVEIAPIATQKDSSIQQPVPKNWAFQYVYL